MNDEFERFLKEAAVAKLRYYPTICVEGLRKTTKNARIPGVLAEIHNEHLPNRLD
jgi:hypothetical protein